MRSHSPAAPPHRPRARSVRRRVVGGPLPPRHDTLAGDEGRSPPRRDVLPPVNLVTRLERLHPAVVADCLDRLGARSQVLDARIRPLAPEMKVAGRAATVRCVEVDAVPPSRDDWYRRELEAVDALRPGDVMVVSTCPGSYWGELLAT